LLTALVEAGACPRALLQEMKIRENEIQRFPFRAACWSRRKWKRRARRTKPWGKIQRDTAVRRRHCCGAWWLGKGLPQINAVVDVIKSGVGGKPAAGWAVRSQARSAGRARAKNNFTDNVA